MAGETVEARERRVVDQDMEARGREKEREGEGRRLVGDSLFLQVQLYSSLNFHSLQLNFLDFLLGISKTLASIRLSRSR